MKFDLGHINKLACVSVHLNGDKTTFHYVILKLHKGEIAFGKSNKHLTDVKKLVKEITTKIPVIIHFSGKGILNRKVKREENYRHAILLNAQLDDFYFTDYLEDQLVYCSVIRRNMADPVIEEITAAKCDVVGVSSGPFITVPISSFFDKKTYVVDDVRLQIEKDKLVGFERSPDPGGRISLGADKIDHDLLGAVAAGAQFFNPSAGINWTNETFGAQVEEAKQKNIFTRFAMGMMFFFLTILTANYFYLGYLNGKIETNYVILSEYEDQLAELSTLEEERERKENLLRSSGLLSREFLSFYLMELSQSVPGDITFESVSVRPLISEIKKKQKIEFYDHLIQVTGRSRTSDLLSRWIDQLKEKEWLSKVDILDYTYAKNVGNFKIEIVLN